MLVLKLTSIQITYLRSHHEISFWVSILTGTSHSISSQLMGRKKPKHYNSWVLPGLYPLKTRLHTISKFISFLKLTYDPVAYIKHSSTHCAAFHPNYPSHLQVWEKTRARLFFNTIFMWRQREPLKSWWSSSASPRPVKSRSIINFFDRIRGGRKSRQQKEAIIWPKKG